MIEYPKIEVPFERDTNGTKKLIEWKFRHYELTNIDWWRWTEKIDGTNISVEWDGHRVLFHGRTERADIPKFLLEKLEELFGGETNEEMFEQLFGDTHMILYGEGYGNKIQNGKGYIPDGVDFILFDVYQPEKDLWLEWENVCDIAQALNINTVPLVHGIYTLKDAVEFVKKKPKSFIGNADLEGLVGVPFGEFKDRHGKRIMTKVKVRDFEI